MVRKEIVILQDDLDGTEGEEVRTVPFGFEGRQWEIDVTKENRDALYAALEPFIAVARPVRKMPQPRMRDRSVSKAQQARLNAACRAWHREQGIPIAGHGRIHSEAWQRWSDAGSPMIPFVNATPKAPRQTPQPRPPLFAVDLIQLAASRNGGVGPPRQNGKQKAKGRVRAA